MTFEEFLIKKKIDLAQLKAAEPNLFSEFRNHYSQMGEKSFDHSKKFLFNKLRRIYHLKEEPKPVAVPEVIEINELASQAQPLLSPSVEATVYTPRFKALVKTPAQSQESTEISHTEQPKPAFKPRFRAGATSTLEPKPAEELQVEKREEKQKIGYIPRFKAPPAINEEQQPGQTFPQTSDPGLQNADPKPAYKPRFKPSTIKPKEE